MERFLELKPFENLLNELSSFLPKLLGAIALFIIAFVLLKLILFVVRKSLKITKVDLFVAKVFEKGEIFNTSIKIQPTRIIIAFVKWFLILVLVIIGAYLIGLTMVSNEVGKIVSYLPQVFSAFVIFGFGVYLATVLSKSTKTMLDTFDLNGSKLISRIVFYLVFLIVTIIALNQAGVNTMVITDNLSIILGALLASFALGLGLGSKDVISRLLFLFYARKNYQIGQLIRIDGFEGRILTIDNICMVVESNTEKRVYPIKEVSNKLVELI